MPSGLKRFQNAESLHFLTFSCFHRLPLLETPEAKETFEAIVEQRRARPERGSMLRFDARACSSAYE